MNIDTKTPGGGNRSSNNNNDNKTQGSSPNNNRNENNNRNDNNNNNNNNNNNHRDSSNGHQRRPSQDDMFVYPSFNYDSKMKRLSTRAALTSKGGNYSLLLNREETKENNNNSDLSTSILNAMQTKGLIPDRVASMMAKSRKNDDIDYSYGDLLETTIQTLRRKITRLLMEKKLYNVDLELKPLPIIIHELNVDEKNEENKLKQEQLKLKQEQKLLKKRTKY